MTDTTTSAVEQLANIYDAGGLDRELASTLRALAAERDRLRVALAFYADFSDYPAPLTGGMGKLYFDCGRTARTAMEESK